MGPKIFLGRAHAGMCGSVCMHSSVNIFRSVNMSGDKCAYVCTHISVYLYLSCFMYISCTCIFILYVHSMYKCVHVCCFVYMYVHEQTHTCVSGNMDNCMEWVCTCVSATECSFTSTAFVTVVALCEKEGFLVASCVCPQSS